MRASSNALILAAVALVGMAGMRPPTGPDHTALE